jgi:hypothetical protein
VLIRPSVGAACIPRRRDGEQPGEQEVEQHHGGKCGGGYGDRQVGA